MTADAAALAVDGRIVFAVTAEVGSAGHVRHSYFRSPDAVERAVARALARGAFVSVTACVLQPVAVVTGVGE
jgi:hypothetical protein